MNTKAVGRTTTVLLASLVLWQSSDVVSWLARAWHSDPYFSHGPLLVAWCLGTALWHGLGARGMRTRPNVTWTMPSPGTLFLTGLALFLLGRAMAVDTPKVAGWWLMATGVIAREIRPERYQAVVFSLCFALLAIPWPWGIVQAIALPVQETSATLSRWILDAINLPVLQRGVILDSGRYRLAVEEPCSGLRSLIALGTAVIWLVGIGRGSHSQRWLLWFWTPAVVMAGNTLRLTVGMVIGHALGKDAAGFWIEHASLLLIVAEIALFNWWLDEPEQSGAPEPPPPQDTSSNLALLVCAGLAWIVLLTIPSANRAEHASTMPPWPTPAGWHVSDREATDAARRQTLHALGQSADVDIIRFRRIGHGTEFVDVIRSSNASDAGRGVDDPRFCYRSAGWHLVHEAQVRTGLEAPGTVTEIIEDHPGFRAMRLDWFVYRIGDHWTTKYRELRWRQMLARLWRRPSDILGLHLSTGISSLEEAPAARNRLRAILRAIPARRRPASMAHERKKGGPPASPMHP